jgi:hypothetical protein
MNRFLIKQVTFCIACMLFMVFLSCDKQNDSAELVGENTTESNKVIENISGTLRYYEEVNMWSIIHFIPGTIDSEEIYLIRDIPNNEFSFEEGKRVFVSGLCYKISDQEVLDLTINKKIVFHAGIDDLYYINVTDLYDQILIDDGPLIDPELKNTRYVLQAISLLLPFLAIMEFRKLKTIIQATVLRYLQAVLATGLIL